MAAQRVFDIGELVENILLRLPLRDLLVATQINAQCNNVASRSRTANQRLFGEAIPQFPAVLDHTPKNIALSAYNLSKRANHCWWFKRITLDANTTMFLLRERRRVFWFLGKQDGSKEWLILKNATMKIKKYNFKDDNFDLEWRSKHGAVVCKVTIDDNSPLVKYLEAFHEEDLAAVWNGPF
ncbi:hypothetical protein LTR85_003571 [Meristemomyces frigidus]|nr:hypothetical protein LTR85_003571 [Meristemomyces frigidus]